MGINIFHAIRLYNHKYLVNQSIAVSTHKFDPIFWFIFCQFS